MVDAFLPSPVARHKAMLVVIPVVWCVARSRQAGYQIHEPVRGAMCRADQRSLGLLAASASESASWSVLVSALLRLISVLLKGPRIDVVHRVVGRAD
jgi:hypothetical protein